MNARSDISSTLLEPTFADAIEGIVAAEEVPQTRRTQLTCSLRKVAEWLQKGPGDVPAKWTSIRFAVGGLHHEQLGVVAKTLANHRSNVRAALAWFAGAADVPKRGAALTPAWAALRVQVSAHLDHTRLSPLMRFCSASGIAPQEVTRVGDRPLHGLSSRAYAPDYRARRPAALWRAPGTRAPRRWRIGRISS